APAELLRAGEIAARPLHLRLLLGDQAARLVDRRVGARDRRVVLGQQRVELGPVETGENLPRGHAVAVLGDEFDDREPVDARGDVSLLARNEGARNEEAL